VTKFIANNWTMHGTNYGEITMGAVYSPDDSWNAFMPLNEFNSFLYTGNRAYLHLPNLNVDGEQNLNVDPAPARTVNNLTVNNTTINNNLTVNRTEMTVNQPQQASRPSDAQASLAMNRLQDYNRRPHVTSGVWYEASSDTYNWIGPKFGRRMSEPASQFLSEVEPFLN
jgi:hypothetical protein